MAADDPTFTHKDLGTLESNNRGASRVTALNSDGSIAAGWATNDNGDSHATVWHGTDYGEKLDLGTLKSDNSSYSTGYALSSDGLIAAGSADKDNGDSHATVWHGTDYGEKLDLGTLKSDNSGDSLVAALSSDGLIAAGWADKDNGDFHATVWHGTDYGEKLDLGTLKSDNSGDSLVAALSSDGLIAAGQASNDNGYWHATVWHGTDYGEKLDLGTLKSDNSGDSLVVALSSDGLIAAGWADKDNRHYHATVWHGTDYGEKLDLGTLKSDNSGDSLVAALSSDGLIAAGWADNANGSRRPVVWKIDWSSSSGGGSGAGGSGAGGSGAGGSGAGGSGAGGSGSGGSGAGGSGSSSSGSSSSSSGSTSTTPTTPTTPKPTPVKPSVSPAFDVDNSRASLYFAGAQTVQVLSAQQQQLQHLQSTCYSAQGFCYGISHEFTASKNTREQDLSLRLGYGFGNGLSLGVVVARPLTRDFPQGISKDSHTLGIGVSARYQHTIGDNANWFVAPSLSASQYQADFTRPVFANTEAGRGRSKLHGKAFSLTAGYEQTLPNQTQWQAYASLRHSDLQRDGYQEAPNLYFPARYETVRLRDTTVALGAQGALPLTDHLSAFAGVEIEQRISGNTPIYRASIPAIGTVSAKYDVARTRGNAHIGVQYQLTPNVNMVFSPYVGRGVNGNGYWGTYLGLKGRF